MVIDWRQHHKLDLSLSFVVDFEFVDIKHAHINTYKSHISNLKISYDFLTLNIVFQ